MRPASLPIALAALVLGVTLAVAEPALVMRYPNGVPQATLAGDFTGASYRVLRAPAQGGVFESITPDHVLCLGTCYADDRSAVPGQSYYYRFDLTVPEGDGARIVSYGPFLTTISPTLARPITLSAFPNPGRGPTTVELHVGGTDATVPGEAAVYDLAGRRIRVLHRGTLANGLTTVKWDGRDEKGEALRGGVYLLRFAARGQQTTLRIIRH